MDVQTHEGHQVHGRPPAVPPRSHDTLEDPVCGMPVTEQLAYRFEHRGRLYHFCSANCQATFVELVEPAQASPPPPEAGSIYTCPMHPGSRQDRTGNCPKCGTTLELLLPSLDDGEHPELKDLKRRFWWTLPLTLVVILLAMFGHSLGWF